MWGFALLVSSCALDRSIDPKLILTDCTANAQCPGSQTCQTTRGFSYCTATSPAFTVEGPTLTPFARIGPRSQLHAVFRASAPVTGAVMLIGPDQARVELAAEPDLRFVLDGAKVAGLKDGPYTLFSFFRDAAGHVVTGAPVDVEVDATAPLARAPRLSISAQPGSLADQFGLPISAAGPRTRITADLVLAEEAQVLLSLLGPDGGAVLAFPTDGGALTVSPPPDPSLPQGPLTARLTLTDAVGNSRTDDAPGVVLDTVVPSLTQTTATLQLAPWGTLDDPTPLSKVTVSGLPEPGELFVFQGAFSVGHGPVDAGTVALSLLQSSPPFEVRLVDRAGNESDPGRVAKVELTFTPRDIDPTDDERVLELRANQVAPRLIANPSLSTQPADGGGLVLASTAAWRARPSVPGVRDNAAVAFDTDREVAVAFGGTQPNIPTKTNGTFEWQGQGWFPRATPVGPPPATRDEVAMAYDSLREVVLLFFGPTGETWSWNGLQWKRIAVPGAMDSAPAKRTRFAMAFDKRAGNLVLFGGEIGGAEQNDTWVWNGLAWHRVDVAAPPAARGGHVMAYHPPSGGVVMFGDDKRGLGDVWWWDGLAETWTKQLASPGPLNRPAMAFDDVQLQLTAVDLSNGRSVALSGSSDGGGLSGFSWDAGAAIPAPAPVDALAFFDPARRAFVLANATTRWSLRPDVGVWTSFKADRPPGVLRNHALAFAASSDTYVMFGGRPGPAAPPNAETLCFGAEGWQQAVTDGGSPPARWGHTLTTIATSPSKLLLHGGFDGTGAPLFDTWQLQFLGRNCQVQWTRRANDVARAGHAAAFDQTRLVVWDADGGAQFQDVGPGGTWGPLGVPETPGPAGFFAGATYDARQERVVVAGGGNTPSLACSLADCRATAFFLRADAGAWAALPPLPHARKGNALWYDEYAGSSFTFGGASQPPAVGAPPAASLARLGPTAWTTPQVTDLESDFEPVERAYHAVAFSRSNASALMFGGASQNATFDDTWDFKIARQRPAVVFHLDLNRFVFKPFGRVTFTDLRIEAVAGGEGFTAAAQPVAVAGAEVQGYLDGRWQTLPNASVRVTNLASLSAPALCSLQTADRLDELLVGNRRLSVAVTPLGESADAPAQLKVTRLAVKIAFELPP